MTFRFLFTITWFSLAYGSMVDELVGVVKEPLEPLFNAIPDKVKDILNDQFNIITEFVDEIEEIGENAFNILEITENLVSVFTEGPFNLKGVGDENFGNTLKTCMNQFRDIVNPLKAFEEVIQIKEFQFISQMPDVEDMTYKILAIALYPMKQVIEWTCTEVVPDVIEFAKQILEGSIVRRTRRRLEERSRPKWVKSKSECKTNSFPAEFMPEEDNCTRIPDERFCESPDDKYFYDTLDSASGDVYASMVEFYSPIICDENGKAVDKENRLLSSPYDNSNTEVYNRFRIAKLLFQIINNLVEGVCDAIDSCIQDTAECPIAPTCAATKSITFYINIFFEFILDNIDLHDAEINNMRLKTIFKDRITIIHNQKAILTALQKGILGITTFVEAAENTEQYRLKKVIKGLGKLQQDFDDQYSGAQTEITMKIDATSNDENELVEINMKPTDLYIFCAVFVASNFVFMIIGMVVMRCYMRYNSDSTGKRQTYQYCPSEMEQININK